jgi:tetratricopeptide (TPR) repeat protein
VASGAALEAVFFRLMDVPGGAILGRRTPAESRQELTSLLDKGPKTSALYTLRAQEDERQLDFKAAEADWRLAVEAAADKTAALLDLAAYYNRRVEPEKQVSTLLEAAKLPLSSEEAFLVSSKTRSWTAFDQALATVRQAKLPETTTNQIYEAWLSRWPDQQDSLYINYFHELANRQDNTAARAVLARYRAKYPDNWAQILESEEELEDTPNAKLAVYSKQFSPSWPDNLLERYYQLLKASHQLRTFLADARQRQQSQPDSLDGSLRVAYYYEQSGNRDIAIQTVRDFTARREASKTAWTADDLKTLGRVFARLHEYDTEARIWYTLYDLKSASATDRKDALASLTGLLLDMPEQPIQFASRDLSLYKNVATMDRNPGFLNGILSLALNSTGPDFEYSTASGTAVAYFHRAAAAQLIDRFRQEFPAAVGEEEQLSTKLFSVYGLYGQDDALLVQLPPYLDRHKQAASYVELALILGDTYARRHRNTEEFALYDRLLQELATKSGHMPLGATQVQTETRSARSADYSRVLDRYLSRLTEAKLLQDAVALFRREINNNPNDPGLYERLATFIEQNRFDSDLEQTYRNAMQKFPGTSWPERLARLYLRQKRNADYEKLTQQLVNTFTGEELEAYLQSVPPNQTLNPQLYRQVNLYAHQRFPHNLAFVRNLVHAYQSKPLLDTAAAEKLLRENWFYASDLETEYLGLLSRTGRLKQELAELPKLPDATTAGNTLALQFAAEGQSWLTHYEDSAPAYAALAKLTPGDLDSNHLALSVHRSLSNADPAAFREALQIAEQNIDCAPRNSEGLTTLGELYAERDQFIKAAPYWNRIPKIAPGESQGYLEAATVFWDYFQYDDALRLIGEGRREFSNPALFAYEAGAIYENKQDTSHAIDEYIRGVLAQNDVSGSANAQGRLLRLGRRKATHDLVEQKTIAALRGATNLNAFHLRLGLLEDQGRRDDLQQLLETQLASAATVESVYEIRADASRLGFESTEELALQRIVSVSTDPIEKLSARLDLASFREGRKDLSGAERDLTALLNENPTVLGVIRANADFYERTKQPAKASAVLEAASNHAQPTYKKDLLREAAERQVEAKNYDAGRKNLDALLATDPYNADLLAAKAATWAKQGDNSALAQFYTTELRTMQQAPLSDSERTDRIAGLRRGYIDALTRLNKYTEALDQYVEILNRFPEDEGFTFQAAHFAQLHQLGDRLSSYYEKTMQASPKDYRWPMVLARIDATLHRYPESIAAYGKASTIRPDRTDFLIAKADLETRLFRFDDALKTNQRLYDLTYHNTAYLEAQALLLVRLGRKEEAVKTLRAALIDGRPPNQTNYLNTARRLMTWNFYPEAQQVFEEGLSQTKDDPDLIPGYDMYLRILTVERKQDQAVQLTSQAVERAAQHKRQFLSGPWMSQIGTTIDQYFTAEEKAQAAKLFTTPASFPANLNLRELLRSAWVGETYAQYLSQHSLQNPTLWHSLDEYQRSRLVFSRLGHQLEAIAKTAKEQDRNQILARAVEAYEAAGNSADELRLLDSNSNLHLLINTERYAKLIANDPAHYSGRIPANDFGNSVVQYLVAHTNAQNSFQALQARATTGVPALWGPVYTALTGLYYSSSQPQVHQSFDTLIGPRTVGTEIGEPAQAKTTHIVGDRWYYYAARYGDYLAYQKRSEAEALLPAGVELNPAASERHVELGDTLRDNQQLAKARQQYQYAGQLSPQRADIMDRFGILDWESGNHPSAVANWQNAFDALRAKIDAGPLAPSFWETARTLFVHANHYGVLSDVKPQADAMLHLYVKRNGAYQFTPFLDGIFTETKNRQTALDWLVNLSRDENGAEILQELIHSPRLPDSERDPVYRESIARTQRTATAAAGDALREAQSNLNAKRLEYIAYLENQKRYAEAFDVLRNILPIEDRPQDVQVRLSALTGQLDSLLADWRAKPETTPDESILLGVAGTLGDTGHKPEANQLLEFTYTQQIDKGTPSVSTYLGLAKLRIEQKRIDEALNLIRDAVVSQGAAFENLPAAGKLLEDVGLRKEAKEYYEQWQKAEPWNPDAQLASARLDADAKRLDLVRKSNISTYQVRISAARAMRSLKQTVSGTTELDVLTQEKISPAQASQPFFVAARVDASAQISDSVTKSKLYSEAIAAEPRLTEERVALAKAAVLAKQSHLAIAAYAGQISGNAPLSLEKAQLNEWIANAHLRLRQDQAAQPLLQAILASDVPSEMRRRVQTLSDNVRTTLRLEALNTTRSPEVNSGIDQTRLVRPKLSKLPEDLAQGEMP